jgi:hypothetical protein
VPRRAAILRRTSAAIRIVRLLHLLANLFFLGRIARGPMSPRPPAQSRRGGSWGS